MNAARCSGVSPTSLTRLMSAPFYNSYLTQCHSEWRSNETTGIICVVYQNISSSLIYHTANCYYYRWRPSTVMTTIIIIIIKNECHSNIIVDRLQGCSLISCNVGYHTSELRDSPRSLGIIQAKTSGNISEMAQDRSIIGSHMLSISTNADDDLECSFYSL